jgi:hypothetical protein
MKFWVSKKKREDARFGDKVIELIREGSFHHQYILDSLAEEFPEKSRFEFNHRIRGSLRQLFNSVHSFDRPFEPHCQEIQIATERGRNREELEHLVTALELAMLQADYFVYGSAELNSVESASWELILSGIDFDSALIKRIVNPASAEDEALRHSIAELRRVRLELLDILKEELEEDYGSDD